MHPVHDRFTAVTFRKPYFVMLGVHDLPVESRMPAPQTEYGTSAIGLSRRAAGVTEPPISRLMHRALARPELISLAAGFVDQHSLPVAETDAAARAMLSAPELAGAALQYGSTAGYRPLRQQILDDLAAADRLSTSRTDPERVVLTAGSNQLLHLATECLCDSGDIVLCAAPTYFVYLGMLAGMGVRAVGVAADEHGIMPEYVAEVLRRREAAGEANRVKAIYVVTYYDNPSGAILSVERRIELLRIVHEWSRRTGRRLAILEDAAYRELRYSGDDTPSLRGLDAERHASDDTVIYAGTFSKSYSPGVRVGWGVLPNALVEPVLAIKGNIDFGSAHFNQVLLSQVVGSGAYRARLASLRDVYRAKRDAMLAACERHLRRISGVHWYAPAGGLYVWLTLPEASETGPSGSLFDRALAEGMLYVPGEYCYPAEGIAVKKNAIRLSFGVQSAERIDHGIAALARAIDATQIT